MVPDLNDGPDNIPLWSPAPAPDPVHPWPVPVPGLDGPAEQAPHGVLDPLLPHDLPRQDGDRQSDKEVEILRVETADQRQAADTIPA